MLRLIAALFLPLLLTPRPASAGCGTADCPADPRAFSAQAPRTLELGYEFEFVPQTQPRIETRDAYVGQIRGHHDEVYTINRIHRLKAAYDASERLGLELALPVVSRSHQHIHHHGGADLRQSWSFAGFGDLGASLRYAFWRPSEAARVSFLFGVEAPTGRQTLRNEQGQEADPPLQPGSGSWDYTTGLSGRLERGRGAYFAQGSYRWNGRGMKEYQLGEVFQFGAGARVSAASWLGLQAQANLRVNREDNPGHTREETGKTGGTALYLSPGFDLAWKGWRTSTLLLLPVYQRVQRIQIVADYGLSFGLYRRFAL